jgi:predicted Rossmann fold flavoprotein
MIMTPLDPSSTYDALIVGGGAAGVFAACQLAQQQPGWRIALLDGSPKLLGKVSISGGGRCNVTHDCNHIPTLLAHYPRGGRWLKPVLHAFKPADMVAWLAQHGVSLHTEADGRMFPTTNDAQTIVQCLTGVLRHHNVTVLSSHRLTALQPFTHPQQPDKPAHWQLTVLRADRTTLTLHAPQVLLATGGGQAMHTLLAHLGQPMVAGVPSLFTLQINLPWLTALAGVSVPAASVALPAYPEVKPQTGPVLITHWGVSGPAVLKASAWGARVLHAAQYRTPVRIDWLANTPWQTCHDTLTAYRAEYPTRLVGGHNALFGLPKALWQALVVHAAQLPSTLQWTHLSNAQLHSLKQALKACELPITGKGVFKEEFVTAGGVDLAGVNPKTMGSLHRPGLFFAGELLDVDGVTGGFNFQQAWASGWVAARAMANKAI